MSIAQRIDALEAILAQEADLLSSARAREVVGLNAIKQDAIVALENELEGLSEARASAADKARLERLKQQAGENAHALRAMRDGLAALFGAMSGKDAFAVGSYDPSGRKVHFDRAIGQYERKV